MGARRRLALQKPGDGFAARKHSTAELCAPPNAKSIPRHHRRRRLAEIEAVIDAEFDRVDLLFDVGGDGIEIAQRIDEGHAVLAEIVEIVFEPGRPIAPESPFDAGARGPADPGLASSEVERERAGAAEAEAQACLLADEAVLVAV